jgi:hypothetical protein
MAGWNHKNANWNAKTCAYCAGSFTPKSGPHKYCSTRCKEKALCGTENTSRQYTRISGRWDKYFTRLCNQKHRKGRITREDCLALLEKQNYKCALSGETLTCRLEVGVRTLTNASIDRIDAKGSYAMDNIQLVCTVLNSFRNETPLDEFVLWCKKVAEYDQ